MALARRLDERRVLYKDRVYPARFRAGTSRRHRSVVGVGGNVGDVRRRFKHLIVALKRDKRVDILRTAPVLKNPPFGYVDQADFFNSVLEIATSMPPVPFLRYLLRLEHRFGRRRSFANAPRTLDLDILFFDALRLARPDLQVPHPHWRERDSVLIPLSYLGAQR